MKENLIVMEHNKIIIDHHAVIIRYIRITVPCNAYTLKTYFYKVKLGYAGVYLFFLIFAPKHRLWVLVKTGSTVYPQLMF